ncbi:MAG: aminoacyl-tRNA hydrolase [Cardiobacteriaceae bacterium]|nr:aminoacyl-tRNA hydrolase [Cardiobacteriaceae bacterium]
MIKLVVGLGNPGEKYQKTRHNAGFWFLDALEKRFVEEKKFQAQYAKITMEGKALHLLKPLTFMNASGRAVSACAKFYGITPEEILVVHDELDLAEGLIRLKFDGGHGGHNGLRDIQSALGAKTFYRLRVGIDRPKTKEEVVNYVLDMPSKAGREAIDAALWRGEKALSLLLNEGAEKAMHWLHSA